MIFRNSDHKLKQVAHQSGLTKSVIIDNNILPFLIQFAKIKLDEGEVIQPHFHQTMNEIFYVVDGEIEFTLDNKIYITNAGDCLVIKFGITHSLRCLRNSEIIYFNIEDNLKTD